MFWPSHVLGTFAAAIAAIAFVAFATVARADVPEAAEADFALGVGSASLGDYTAAAEHFRRADAAAPGSATVHFNLGLAQAQIAGRELSATCWLGAYLAAEPYSRLRPSIEAVIDGLQAEQRRTVVSLIEVYEALAAVRVQAEQEHRDDANADVARFWLRLGEVERAKAAASRITPSSVRAAKIEAFIAKGERPLAYARAYEMFKTPYETYSEWDRVWRWAMQDSEDQLRRNAERGKAWADGCKGTTLSKPMFVDTMGYVREVGRGAAATELLGAWRVLDTLEGAIDEIITVSYIEAYEVRRLRNLGAVPWVSFGGMAIVAAILIAAFLLILFDVAFRRARSVAMPVTLQGLIAALVGTPIGIAASLYFPISIAEAITTQWPATAQAWIGFVIGLGIGSLFFITILITTVVGIAAIVVKLSGRALHAAKEE